MPAFLFDMFLSRLAYYLSSIPVLLTNVKSVRAMVAAFIRRPSQPFVLELRNGTRFSVRSALDIWVLKETFIERQYERFSVPIEDGWTVVDIGAGLGDFAVSAAQEHPHNRVYAFEPLPSSFALLQENARLNQASNIHAFPISINGHAGLAELHAPSSEPAHSITVPIGLNGNANGPQVRTISLDEVFEQLQLSECDYMKVDCEGAEYEILFNASAKTLRKIKHICLEYHDWLTPYSHRDLARFFRQQGFRVARMPSPVHRGLGLLYAARNGTGHSIEKEDNLNGTALI